MRLFNWLILLLSGQLMLLLETSPIPILVFIYLFSEKILFPWRKSLYSAVWGLYVWLLASWRLLRDNDWIYLEWFTNSPDVILCSRCLQSWSTSCSASREYGSPALWGGVCDSLTAQWGSWGTWWLQITGLYGMHRSLLPDPHRVPFYEHIGLTFFHSASHHGSLCFHTFIYCDRRIMSLYALASIFLTHTHN